MSRRSYTWNAYETTTVESFQSGASSLLVESAIGLVPPILLVVDPDDPGKREWIRVNTINGNNLENIVRNLEGSVGDITHESGAKVRAIFTKQVQDDIFNDIEDLETGLYNHKIDTGDPHANAGYLKEDTANGLYLTLSGGYMKGPIDMGGYLIRNLGVPVQKEDAVTKGYVDDELAYHTSISDAHHARYTDQEAVDAQAGLWLPIHGTADAATKWATARTLTVKLEGDLSGTASTTLDGTANKTITITGVVLNDSHTHDTRYYTKGQSDDRFLSLTTPMNKVGNSFAAYRIRNVWVGSSTPSSTGRQTGDLWLKT